MIESAKLAEIKPHAYLETAIHAAFRGAEIPFPHEPAQAATSLTQGGSVPSKDGTRKTRDTRQSDILNPAGG